MLEVKNLYVSYGPMVVLRDISLQAKEKKITAILGSNGAGKSTLLYTIAGILKPIKGAIFYKKEDITVYPPNKRVEKGITLLPEGGRLFPNLSVIENLKAGACIARAQKRIADNLRAPQKYNENTKPVVLLLGEGCRKTKRGKDWPAKERELFKKHGIPIFILSNTREKDIDKAVKPFKGEWEKFINYIVTNLNASTYSSLNISSTLNGSGIGRATNKLREKWWIRWPPVIAIPGFKVYLSSRGKGESNFTVEIYGGSLKGVFKALTNGGWKVRADADLIVHMGPKVAESLSWRGQVSTSEYFYPGLITEGIGVINDEVSRLELSAYNSRLKLSAGISGGQSMDYNFSLSGSIGRGTLVNYTEYYGGGTYTDHWQTSGLILGDVTYKLPWPWPGIMLLPSGEFLVVPPNMSNELYLSVSEGYVNYLARGALRKVWNHNSLLEANAQDIFLRINTNNVTYPFIGNFTHVNISLSNGTLSLDEESKVGSMLLSNVDLSGRGRLGYCDVYTSRFGVRVPSYRGQFHALLNLGREVERAFIRVKGVDLLGYFGLGIRNFKFINNSSAFTEIGLWKGIPEELKEEVEGLIRVKHTSSYAHGYYNITNVGYGYALMNITDNGYSFSAEGGECQYWVSMTLRDEHWKEIRLEVGVGGTPYLEGFSNFDLADGIHTSNISGHRFYVDIDASRYVYRGYVWREWYSARLTGYLFNRTTINTLLTLNKLYANYSADESIYGYSLTDVSDNSYRFNLSSGDVNYYLGRPYGWLNINVYGKGLEGLLNVTSSNRNDQVYSQWDSIGGSAYVNLGGYGFSTGLHYYYEFENIRTTAYTSVSPDIFSASLNATGIGYSYATTNITGNSYLYTLEAKQEACIEAWWLGSLYIINGFLGGYANLTKGVHRFFTYAENINFIAPFGGLGLTDGYLRGTLKAHNATYNLAFDGEGRYWSIGLMTTKSEEQSHSRACLWGNIDNGELTGYIGSSPGRLIFNLSSHHRVAFVDLECRQEISCTEPSSISFLYNIPGFFYTSPNPYVDVSLSSFTGDISSL